jgi:glycosyltransferase involved in cell wall biosynthesis
VRISMPPEPAKPRLAVFTHVVRADFHNELKHFRHFEVWHFYRHRAPDLPPNNLGPRAVQFRNLIDLVLKATRLRPTLIQGGEPFDFPTQLPIVLGALIVARLLRVPYYSPIYENIPVDTKFSDVRRFGIRLDGLIIPLVRWLAQAYGSRAMLFFALNSGARRNLLDAGVPPQRISNLLYATWGVDIDHFSPRRDGKEPDMGPNGLLFVGRLVPDKGIPELMRAFLRVRESLTDVQLYIIGDGPLIAGIRQIVDEHQLHTAVHILGTIENHSLPPYFRAARVTVSPSVTTRRWTEQAGMVNIQSMACGTPVVSTLSGSISEFVPDGEAGILVPERDSEALAKAIVSLLTDKRQHQRLSEFARAYVVQRYDAPRNVAAVEDVLVDRLVAVQARKGDSR